MEISKPVNLLTTDDILKNPVWAYVDSPKIDQDETFVNPVSDLPCKDLEGKIVGTEVKLACGKNIFAIIGNIDIKNPELSEHFLTISFFKNGVWYTLSRYHDSDYSTNGPTGLALFLGLELSEIFPIEYDISMYINTTSNILIGQIAQEPQKKLTAAELIKLAVP